MEKPGRRYDLDWLRVLLILSVFLFHSGRTFHWGDWHVFGGTSPGLATVLAFMEMWMLPTIFVISAAAIWYSLGYRKVGRFVWSRVLRLFVPLMFGAFVLSPHQVYLERFTHGQFGGTFIQWFPNYFQGLYGVEEGGNFAFHGMHLWYLMLLFFYSLLLLPLFLFLRSRVGRPLVRGIGAFLKTPGLIYLLGFVLALPMAYINPDSILGLREFAGWNMVFYIIILFFGYVIFADERAQRAIVTQRYVSLLGGIALYLLFKGGLFIKSGPHKLWWWFQYTLSSWCFVLAILGFGMKCLKSTGPFLGYATEAVLPFYMLHQPVILLIALWVITLQIPVIAKYLLIIVVSFIGIMIPYEIIRRVNVLRFLFGMKLKKAYVNSKDK